MARELAVEGAGHIYTRQACANAWLAIGAIRLRQSRVVDAVGAFDQVLDRVAGHPLALAAMSVVADADRRATARARLDERLVAMEAHGAVVEAAMARSVADVLAGHHARAASRVHVALQAAPAGSSAGWTLPVEPLFHVTAHTGDWAAVLAELRSRAA